MVINRDIKERKKKGTLVLQCFIKAGILVLSKPPRSHA